MAERSGFQSARPENSAPRTATNFMPSSMRTDPLAYLPPAAADRLRALRQRAADAHAVTVGFQELSELRSEQQKANARLKQLTSSPQDHGFNLGPDHPSVLAAARDLAKLSDDLRRLNERSEARAAAWQSASAALLAVESWLKAGQPGGTVLEDYNEGPEPKLNKGEGDVVAAIENRRRRVRELRATLNQISSSPFPSSYCKRRCREEIEQLAMRGTPSVARLVEHDGPVDFQILRLQSQVFGAEQRSLAFTETADAVALVTWLHKDALIAALDREIDTERRCGSTDARGAAGASCRVQADLLAAERAESFFCWLAESRGLSIEHRADVNPLALLGLALVIAVPASLPGTSPMMGIDYAGP